MIYTAFILVTFMGSTSLLNFHFDHFYLQGVLEKHSIDIPFTKLGPRVLIFHETQYTEILGAPEDDGTEV